MLCSAVGPTAIEQTIDRDRPHLIVFGAEARALRTLAVGALSSPSYVVRKSRNLSPLPDAYILPARPLTNASPTLRPAPPLEPLPKTFGLL